MTELDRLLAEKEARRYREADLLDALLEAVRDVFECDQNLAADLRDYAIHSDFVGLRTRIRALANASNAYILRDRS